MIRAYILWALIGMVGQSFAATWQKALGLAAAVAGIYLVSR
jgi:hypothetical protein